MLPLEDDRYPNRGMWIFAGFFFAMMAGGSFFQSADPYKAAKIYFSLDEYIPVTFTAQRVIENTSTRRGRINIVSRDLIGVIQVNQANNLNTAVLTSRQVEIAFGIPNANILQLSDLTLQKRITVLFDPKIEPHYFGDESLVLIANDPAAHRSVFLWSVAKTCLILLWFLFCVYMWLTYPDRYQRRVHKELSDDFARRRSKRT